MADSDDIVVDITAPPADEESAPDQMEEGSPFVSEGDDTDDPEPEGDEEAAPEPEPEARQIAQRLEEKERQTHGLTVALSQERKARRIAEDRLYQVIDRAMAYGSDEGAGGEQGPPDPETDAAGAIMHRLGSLEDRLVAQEQDRLDILNEQRVDNVVDDAEAFLMDDAERFQQTAPDFPQAQAFVAERIYGAIHHRLRLENPGADPNQVAVVARQVYTDQLAQIHIEHARTRTSFARELYRMARAMGYNGATAPARRPLDAHRQRLQTGRSLSNVTGGQPRRPINAKSAVNMTDEEFEKLLDTGVDWKTLAAAAAGE